jgi:hypothetical protein
LVKRHDKLLTHAAIADSEDPDFRPFVEDEKEELVMYSDEWTAQFFSNKPAQRQPMPSYLAGSRRTVLSSSASPLDLAPPTASIESDEKQGDVRKIRLNIRSQRDAEMLALTLGNDVKPVSLRSGAREIRPRERSGSLSITLYGMEAKGANLELSFKPSSNVSFWLVDRTVGLPTKVRARSR